MHTIDLEFHNRYYYCCCRCVSSISFHSIMCVGFCFVFFSFDWTFKRKKKIIMLLPLCVFVIVCRFVLFCWIQKNFLNYNNNSNNSNRFQFNRFSSFENSIGLDFIFFNFIFVIQIPISIYWTTAKKKSMIWLNKCSISIYMCVCVCMYHEWKKSKKCNLTVQKKWLWRSIII